jgi:hypothetical protein
MTYMVSLGTLDSSWPICEYLKFEIIVKKHVKILSWCHSVRDNKEDIPVQCIISSYSKLYFIYYTFSRYDASASNASASSNAYPLDHSNPTDRWCSACIYTPFARPFLLPLDIPNIYQVYCLYLVFSGIGDVYFLPTIQRPPSLPLLHPWSVITTASSHCRRLWPCKQNSYYRFSYYIYSSCFQRYAWRST